MSELAEGRSLGVEPLTDRLPPHQEGSAYFFPRCVVRHS